MDRGKLSALYSQTRPSTSHRNYQDGKKVGDRYDEKINDALHEKGEAWQENDDGVDAEEKELRGFDMDTRYGPLSGLTRIERWERAKRLGLDPPNAIKELVLKHGAETEYNQHVFTEGKI